MRSYEVRFPFTGERHGVASAGRDPVHRRSSADSCALIATRRRVPRVFAKRGQQTDRTRCAGVLRNDLGLVRLQLDPADGPPDRYRGRIVRYPVGVDFGELPGRSRGFLLPRQDHPHADLRGRPPASTFREYVPAGGMACPTAGRWPRKGKAPCVETISGERSPAEDRIVSAAAARDGAARRRGAERNEGTSSARVTGADRGRSIGGPSALRREKGDHS